jgi:hypothetical protein
MDVRLALYLARVQGADALLQELSLQLLAQANELNPCHGQNAQKHQPQYGGQNSLQLLY